MEDGDSIFTEESIRKVGDTEIRTLKKVENTKTVSEDNVTSNRGLFNNHDGLQNSNDFSGLV